MKQRGFGILAYLIAGGALLAVLAGLYWGIERHGYARGAAAVQLKWEAANREAAAEQREREKAVSKALTDADTVRQAAQDRASDYNVKWQEVKRELQRKNTRLAVQRDQAGVSATGKPEAPAVDAAPDVGAGVGIRVTWGFVQLYDSAWTGTGGEPVFPIAAGYSPTAGPGAASPYGPADIVEVHGENAQRCSADREELRALMARIRMAEEAWDSRRGQP
jgi:hypothetical protein